MIHLRPVDDALKGCFAATLAKDPKASAAVGLSFLIRWNRKIRDVSLSGGDAALQTCVREALPLTGWPEPGDFGDAKVVRTWSLAAK